MLRGAIVCAALVLGASTVPAHAARKSKAEPLTPVDVTVSNTCTTALSLTLGTTPLTLEPAASSPPTRLVPTAVGEVFTLATATTPPVELARLGFSSGPTQTVKVTHCRGGHADVFSGPTALPAGVSPLATAQARFRSRQASSVLEYAVGAAGAFRPLSVAMTSYASSPPGDLVFSVRQRVAKNGPIMATVKKTVQLAPDRRYLLEVELVGGDLVLSMEDEGKAVLE